MSRKKPEKEKKREEKAILEAAKQAEEDAKPKGWRASWEWRSAKFVLRVVGVLFFLGYLSLTGPSGWSWAKAKWALQTPLEELPQKADYYLNQVYKPEKLYELVSMRPPSETEKIIKLLEPYTARMSSYTFLLYSARLKGQGKTDDALFWWQFARFRARFDALRCGSSMAVDNLNHLLKVVPHPDFPPDAETDRMTVVKSLTRVLDYDANYPADNIPEDLCDPLRAMEDGKYQSVGYSSWKRIRHTLRAITESRLQQMEDDIKKGVRQIPDNSGPSMWEELDKALKEARQQQQLQPQQPPQ